MTAIHDDAEVHSGGNGIETVSQPVVQEWILPVQIRRVKSLRDYTQTIKELLKEKGTQKIPFDKEWYFLPGAHYTFKLLVTPERPGKRSYRVQVNGMTVFNAILSAPHGAKTDLSMRAVGRVLVKRLGFSGRPAK